MISDSSASPQNDRKLECVCPDPMGCGVAILAQGGIYYKQTEPRRDNDWIVYITGFSLCVVILSLVVAIRVEEWDRSTFDKLIPVLANVVEISIGAGLLTGFAKEVGSYMVLYGRISRRKQQLIEQGKVEGVKQTDAEWEAWIRRRDEALANNEPFDEPPPPFLRNCANSRGS